MQVATEITTFTCICCPLGCRLEVSFDEAGEAEVEGHSCARGASYAVLEATAPRAHGDGACPGGGAFGAGEREDRRPRAKECVPEVLDALRRLRVAPPVHAGDVLLANVCATGVDVVATKDVA